MTSRMPQVLEHAAEHDDQGERKDQDVDARQKVGPGAGVLEGMRRVGAEEAAAVGAEVLDRDDGRHRAAGDLLRQGLPLVVLPMASSSRVEATAAPSNVIGTPSAM